MRGNKPNTYYPRTRTYRTGTGQALVNIHPADRCAGEACVIHNPSDHHMRDWPTHWRADRRIMERICPHGVGHPDPDDPSVDTVHGCDGCCSPQGYQWLGEEAA